MKTGFSSNAALLMALGGSFPFAANLAAEESAFSVVTILSDYQVLVEEYDTNGDNLLNGEDVSSLPAALQAQLRRQLTSKFGLDDSQSLTDQLATLREQYGNGSSSQDAVKSGISEKLDSLRSQYVTGAAAGAGEEGESSGLPSGFESIKKALGN